MVKNMKVKKVGNNEWIIELKKVFYPKEYIEGAYQEFLDNFDLKIEEREEKIILKFFGNLSENDIYEFLNYVLAKIKEVI